MTSKSLLLSLRAAAQGTTCFLLLAMVLPFRPAAGAASKMGLPLVKGEKALASVNGDPVTWEEFREQVGTLHAGALESSHVPKPRSAELLGRLVNARLLVQEAERMGLDETPEVERALDAYRRNKLRDLLFHDHAPAVASADKADVEALYRQAVLEYDLRSVLFEKEEDARTFAAAVRAGGSFETLAREATAARKAKGGEDRQFVRRPDLRPEIEAQIRTMKPGQVSPVVKIEGSFALIKLNGSRIPDDPKARSEAEAEALKQKRLEALKRYTEGLKAKYATVDEDLLESLDFEAKQPGFESLLKDARPLARVTGEEPVRVLDLAKAIEAKFFHGVEQAASSKRLNRQKREIVDDILAKRVVVKEALRLKLDRSPSYRRDYEGLRRSLLFGVFAEKVVNPGIKVSGTEARKYFSDHIKEYTTPEMMRLEALAFETRKEAEAALQRLRKGADIKWMRSNAAGQASRSSHPDLLVFDGGLIATPSMPAPLARAVAGASSGDYRFYEEAGKATSYVLHVHEAVPSRPQPFEAVKEEVSKKLFLEKQQESVAQWAATLRAASDVKIFADGDTLDRLLAEAFSGGH